MLLAGFTVNAQATFISKGKLEFERKTNSHRLNFSGETGTWVEEMKKLIPQFRTDYFELTFDETKSLYAPGRESTEKQPDFFMNPAPDNVVYKDLAAQSVTSSKSVFEARFLLSDSLGKRTWKIEPETRTIAGFECRKAITTICDSVVVVAFYTDQIIPSSGPESFSGLPGMILGLAIPRLYTTWFATSLKNIEASEEKKITPPVKGKKASSAEMNSAIGTGIKSWGTKYLDRTIWTVSL